MRPGTTDGVDAQLGIFAHLGLGGTGAGHQAPLAIAVHEHAQGATLGGIGRAFAAGQQGLQRIIIAQHHALGAGAQYGQFLGAAGVDHDGRKVGWGRGTASGSHGQRSRRALRSLGSRGGVPRIDTDLHG